MVGLLIHYMAPIMFMALVVFLLLGYPVAFSLGAVGLIFGFIGIEVGLFRPDFLQALPERIYGIMNNDVLLAIPFFTFMGLVLERSGMAEDLLDTIGQLFGTIRGAFLPGLALAAMYAVYIFLVSILYPKAAPGLPVQDIGYREPDGARGVWQLGILVLYSGVVAYYLMRGTNVRAGADFVVLTMSIGVVVSFLCSVFDRVFGARHVYVTAILAALFAAAWYYLGAHNHENWALLSAALMAGPLFVCLA